MATESTLLGTPAVHMESIVFQGKVTTVAEAQHGIQNDLVNKYKLSYTFADQYQALDKALEILQDESAKENLKKKVEKLLNEKIDVTKFMTDFIERYPESYYEYINSKKRHYESKKTS